MNERIQELAEQADKYAKETVPYYNRQSMKLTIENKINQARDTKFADLIIQNCISQIALIGISNYENEDIAWAISAAIKAVKEHFGVEE